MLRTKMNPFLGHWKKYIVRYNTCNTGILDFKIKVNLLKTQ